MKYSNIAAAAFSVLLISWLPAGPLFAAFPQSGGGPADDRVVALATTAAGETYALGNFSGSGLFGGTAAGSVGTGTNPEGTTLESAGSTDLFLAKFNLSGDLLWIRRAGGSGADQAFDVEVDAAGNAYLAGSFRGVAQFGSFQLNAGSEGGTDGFAAKVDPAGNWLWVTKIGGKYFQETRAIAVTTAGEVFVAGRYQGEASFFGHGAAGASHHFGDHFSSAPAPPAAPPPVGVRVYDNNNFGGTSSFFSGDDPSFGNDAIGNNNATSIEMQIYCTATLYAVGGFGGDSAQINFSSSNLGDTHDFNDDADSIKVNCQPGANPYIPSYFNGLGFDRFLARIDGGSGSFSWAVDAGNGAGGNDWATGLAVNGGNLVMSGKSLGGSPLKTVAAHGLGWQKDFTSGERAYHAVGERKGDYVLEMTSGVSLPAFPATSYLEFQHRRDLGAANQGAGVIEVSIDGGVNWVDGAIYGGFTSGSDRYAPNTERYFPEGIGTHYLAGREVFKGRNPGWPDYDLVRIDVGILSLFGMPVRFRWRMGSSIDQSADAGWWIKDIKVGSSAIATSGPEGNVFLAGYTTGGGLSWTTNLPATVDALTDLELDAGGAVFSVAYDETSPGQTSTVLQRHESGGAFGWQATLGSGVTDGVYGSGVALDPANVYVATQRSNAGSYDVFVAKYAKTSAAQLWATATSGGSGKDLAYALSYGAGNLFLGGAFEGSALFADRNLKSQGGADAFVAVLELDAGGGPGTYPSSATWYAGQEIPPPSGADVATSATNCIPEIWIDNRRSIDALNRLFFWSYAAGAGRLHAVQQVDGNVEIRWRTAGCDILQPNLYKSSLGAVGWPQAACPPGGGGAPCFQVHVARSPVEVKVTGKTRLATPILPSRESSAATIANDVFTTSSPGYAVLAYTAGAAFDPSSSRVELVVVKTFDYGTAPDFTSAAACTVGTELLAPAGYAEPGRTGFVVTQRAFYEALGEDAAYKREARTGQILPVNAVHPLELDAERSLVVAWYRTNSQNLWWPEKAIQYDCQWPAASDTLVIANELGSEHGGQPLLTATAFPNKRIYQQPNPALPGFNPNDEHALFVPSNGGSGVEALFALRSDFALLPNQKAASRPYVLLKYRDPASVALPVASWKLKVYQVLATAGGPLAFEFPGTAGTPVYPPYPLRLLQSCSQTLIDGQSLVTDPVPEPFFKDHKGQVWAKSQKFGYVRYHYPLQETFFYDLDDDQANDAGFAVGSCVPWLARLPVALGADDENPATPVRVGYDIRWPANVPVLKVGETLLAPKAGLPDIVNQAKVEVIFDELQDQTRSAGIYDPTKTLVRLIEPLAPRAVVLPLLPAAVASTLDPATGFRRVTGNTAGTLKLSAEIAARVAYDPLNKKLVWSGVFDESSAGEPLLLINVLTDRDRRKLKQLDGGDGTEAAASAKRCAVSAESCTWDEAVEALYHLSRNPNAVDSAPYASCSVTPLPIGNSGSFFYRQNCPNAGDGAADRDLLIGLANDGKLTVPATAAAEPALTAGFAAGTGYLTVAFNNDPALGALPVSLNVIRVDCLRQPEACSGAGCSILATYQGEIDILEPDNVFDEQLTLRHSGDFAGRADDVTFEWYTHPDVDGTPPSPLPDPANGQLHGWMKFSPPGGDQGAHAISIEGANPRTLSDNWFLVRYELPKGPGPDRIGNTADDAAICKPGPGLFTGQPGSTPITPRAQLAEGWVKRVLKGLNPFDARVKDFHAGPANTYASMLVQLGERYEGDIAFNPDAGNLNQIGLIEAYETVLRRGRKLSIDASPPIRYEPADNALLLVASRLTDFYLLLGNEAFADAQDPMVGITTESESFGSLAPTIFTFENQVSSLLEEELILLRGRDSSQGPVAARPVYNRFFWNFTTGEGEVAYALSYNITDQNGDGFVNEFDARRLYPQGHGDAWGHYLTATKTYYQLLRHPFFAWTPRPEAIVVAGVPIQVDFFDERKFAAAAAAKARTGAQLVQLSYRRSYVEDPSGQWQGYKDGDQDRAWGLSEWAQRAGQGAYLDWVTTNSILPAVDPKTCGLPGVPAAGCHVGIKKVDRESVAELTEIVAHYDEIQGQLDRADRGLNPLGLAKGVVPFDIDPARVAAGETHFEQVLDRAEQALQNTVQVWDFANSLNRMLRFNQDSVEALSAGNDDAETDFKNRMIEIFGYPYSNHIGPGETYPAGYDGPDVYHFLEVDAPDLAGVNLDAGLGTHPQVQQYSSVFQPLKNGLNFHDFDGEDPTGQLNCAVNPLGAGCALGGAVEATLTTRNFTWRSADLGIVFIKDPNRPGTRRATGKIQDAITEAVQAQLELQTAIKAYDKLYFDINQAAETLEATFNIQADKIRIKNNERNTLIGLSTALTVIKSGVIVAKRIKESLDLSFDTVQTCIPDSTIVGVAAGGDILAPVSCTLASVATAAGVAFDVAIDATDIAQLGLEQAKEQVPLANAIEIDTLDNRLELYNLTADLESLVKDEPSLRVDLAARGVAVQQAFQNIRNAVAEGQRVLSEQIEHRKGINAAVTNYRYQDMGFRIFRNDAIQKYRAQFDLAARYAYLAAAAYDYETNLLDSDTRAGQTFLTDIVRERAIGQVLTDGVLVPGSRGLADPLGRMKANFTVLKGQMGFNNPQIESNRFSLRRELYRILGNDPAADEEWRDRLQEHMVDDLWQVEEFRRFARPFAPESLGKQPGLVIPFSTTVTFGLNFFGFPLGAGESSYDASSFATRVRGVGVWLDGYGVLPLSATPRMYLFPVGADVLRTPTVSDFKTREWTIVDQALPTPFPIGATSLADPEWIPQADGISGSFGQLRRFTSQRAYDLQVFDSGEITADTRLIGRSVWNTKWVLIIPGGTLLNNPRVGLDTLVFGPGGNGAGLKDILFSFQTYAYTGF